MFPQRSSRRRLVKLALPTVLVTFFLLSSLRTQLSDNRELTSMPWQKIPLPKADVTNNTNDRIYESQGVAPETNNKHLDKCPENARFLERQMNLTVLASYPGSGNTWLRHLIEKMTGYATGSNWSDKQLLDNGFIGEFVINESVIVVKTHDNYNDTRFIKESKRVILLMRNPYDTLLAEFNRYYMGNNHVKHALIGNFIRNWEAYLEENVNTWQPYYSMWLDCENILPVFYDDLQLNMKSSLSSVLEFLDDGMLTGDPECAIKDSNGRFHRDRSFQPQTSFFYGRPMVSILNNAIDTLEADLNKRFNVRSFDLSKWKIHFKEE